MNKEFKTYEFVSRQQSYSAVLRSGMSENRATGQQLIPGIHLKFSNGYAKINRPINGVGPEELYEMVQLHPAYGKDFMDVTDSGDKKPFGENKALSEPEHEIMQMKHGSVIGVTQPSNKNNFNTQQQDVIKGMFAEMLDSMPASKLEEILAKKQDGRIVPESSSVNLPIEETGKKVDIVLTEDDDVDKDKQDDKDNKTETVKKADTQTNKRNKR